MLEILPTNTLWCKILSCGCGEEVQIPAMSSLFESNTFPKYSEEEITNFRTKFGTTSDNVEAMKENNYPFVFKADILQQIMNYSDIETVAPQFVISYILNSYIAWTIDSFDGKNMDKFPLILDSLIFLIESENEYIIEHAKQMAASAFFNVFTYYSIEHPDANYSDTLVPIEDFFTKIPNISPDAYDLIIKLAATLIGPTAKRISPKGAELLTIVGNMIESNPDFPKTVFLSIQMIIENAFLALDKVAMSFFLRFIESIKISNFVRTISKIPESIADFLHETPVQIYYDPSYVPKKLVIDNYKYIPCDMEWVSYLTFDSKMEIPEAPTFGEESRVIDLLPDEISNKLRMMCELIVYKSFITQTFLTAWAHVIGIPSNDEHYFDVVASLVIFLNSISTETDVEFIIDTLIDTAVFDDRLTVFNCKDKEKSEERIHVIRNFVIDHILGRTKELPEYNFLEKFLSCPLIYAEVIYTLVSPKYIETLKPEFGFEIINHNFLLQSKSKDCDDEVRKSINVARVAIFYAISKLFEKEEFTNYFLENKFFLSSLRTVAFEDPCRWFAFKYIEKYHDNQYICERVQELFTVIYFRPLTAGTQEIVIDCLNLWIKFVELGEGSKYETFIPGLFTIMKEANKMALTNELIIALINFARVSWKDKIKKSIAQQIIEIIQTKYENPDDRLLINMFSIVAGQKLESLDQVEEFVQPKFLNSILAAFEQSPKLFTFLDLIIRLCDGKLELCEKCRTALFDISILDLIGKWIRAEEEGKSEEVKKLLQVFDVLETGGCTSSATHKFISLMCPINCEKHALYFDEIFTFFEQFVQRSLREPGAYIPIAYKNTVSVFGCDNTVLLSGFTFTTWVKVKKQDSVFRLFTITDSLGDHLIVSYDKGSFFIQYKEDKYFPQIAFVVNKWVHISVSFINEDDKMKLVVYTNGKKLESVGEIPKFAPANGQIDIITGNPPYEANLDDFSADHGQIALFSLLTDDEVEDLFVKGSRNQTNSAKAWFILSPKVNNNKMSLTGFLQKGLVLKGEKMEPTNQPGFALTLTSVTGLSFLLPLFAHSHLPPGPSVFYRVLDVVLNLLSLGQEAEAEFLNSFGFGIIAYFLSNEESLDYETYLKFVELLPKLSNDKLQAQLGQCIIFNSELWFKCSNADHRKIIKNWREIYTTKKTYGAKIPLNQLIQSLRTHYFYDTTEKELISHADVERDEDFDINGIRLDIVSIASRIASHKMNNIQLMQILTQLFCVSNSKAAEEIANILKRVINSVAPDNAQGTSIFNIIGSVQYLIGTGSEKLNKKLIEIILLCHEKRLITSATAYDQFTTIAFQIPPGFGSKELIEEILEMEKKTTLPLLFVLAYNADCLDFLLDNIVADVSYPNMWYVVPAMVLFRAPREIMRRGVKFFLSCTRNTAHFLEEIDSLGRLVTGHELFLHELLDEIITNKQITTKTVISDVVYRSLLMRPEGTCSNSISKLIKETYDDFSEDLPPASDESATFDFANSVREKFSSDTRLIKLRKNEQPVQLSFHSYAADVESDPKAYRFDNFFRYVKRGYLKRCYGIQVDENGNWIDKELVEKVSGGLGVYASVTKGIFINHNTMEEFERFTETATKIADKPDREGLEKLKAYASRISNSASILSKSGNEDPASFSSRAAVRFLDSVNKETNTNFKTWHHLWKKLTCDASPWSRSINTNQQERYKVDPHLCFGMLPLRMKRNFRYSKHETASKARDSKDFVVDRKSPKKQAEQLNPKLRKPKHSEFEDMECEIINITRKVPAILTVTEDSIILSSNDSPGKVIKFLNIYSLMLRAWNQKPTAIEIVTLDGRCYLINLIEMQAIYLLQQLDAKMFANSRFLMQSNFAQFFSDQPFTKQWLSNTMSNFEYLMHLNNFAGRTFSSLCLYPYLPWVLRDYSIPINPRDPSIFRDFSKPIGIQNKENDEILEAKYNRMKNLGMPPFYFSYGPIYPKIICNFLVRLEPFATYHIEQGGSEFDDPQYIFKSIPDYGVSQSYNECIPEFFFSPDFMKNENNFDLGSVNGEKINDVQLPQWASSPFDFVYKHRRLLETNYVRQHLNEWIDLNFGYKQKGEEAEKAHNVYIQEMYPEAWDSRNAHKEQIETVMETLGQLPQQLFDYPHPASPIKPLKKHEATVEYKIMNNNLIVGNASAKGSFAIFTCVDSEGKGRTIRMKSFDTSHEDVLSEYHYKDQVPKIWCRHPLGFLYTCDCQKLMLFNTKKNASSVVYNHAFSITCMACDGINVVIGDSDSCLLIFKAANMAEPRSIINCYRSAIRAVKIISSMNIATAVTRDGNVVIASINDKSVCTVAKVGHEKAIVEVTPTWGFSIICENKSILILTVNGKELKRCSFANETVAIASARTSDFFDVVAIVDSENDVYAFDAYLPESRVKAGTLPSKPISMSISADEMVINVLCENGIGYFIPLPPEAMFPPKLFEM